MVSLILTCDLIKIKKLEYWPHGSNTQGASERVCKHAILCVKKKKCNKLKLAVLGKTTSPQIPLTSCPNSKLLS